jgi:mono/diheme cytochrome c family protein
MLKRLWITAFAAMLAAGISYADQSQPRVTIQVAKTPANNGHQMYGQYCAPCHGVDGRGQGPVAPALKIAPADLTVLTRNNHGRFPDAHIVSVLQSGVDVRAHGTAEMPVWGPILGRMNQNNPQDRLLRVSNLSRYLESMQVK